MKVDFQGRNCEVEPILVKHAQPRLESLSQFNDHLRDVRLTLSKQRGTYAAEITCELGGNVLRAEMRDGDPLAAFDQVLDKIERQLVRYKDRAVDRRKRGAGRRGVEGEVEVVAAAPVEEEEPEFPEFNIVRVKSHSLKPMSPQEAVLQMEMVGHDFYVFLDGSATRVGVVYRRKEGGYGLIEPEIEEENEE